MRPAASIVCVGLVCAGCAGGGGVAPRPGPPPTCAVPARGLEGFVEVEREEQPHPYHVGVRLQLRDPAGRRIYFLLGIPGEVGEGLPLVGDRLLVSGTTARLLGEEDRWALTWDGEVPCEDMAIVGNGISRRRFERALRGAAILP